MMRVLSYHRCLRLQHVLKDDYMLCNVCVYACICMHYHAMHCTANPCTLEQHMAREVAVLSVYSANACRSCTCTSHTLCILYCCTVVCTAFAGFLFYVLGVSAVGGLAFMLLSMPLGKWTATKTQVTTVTNCM
jgi:hypothetical protein